MIILICVTFLIQAVGMKLFSTVEVLDNVNGMDRTRISAGYFD
jgi:hypothetical protein